MRANNKNRRIVEKRKTSRLHIPLNIEYRVMPKQKIIKEKLTDISGGGVKLTLDSPLKKGERLKTLIYFPEERLPITAFSEVVWCKPRMVNNKKKFDLGVKYVKITPRDRNRFIFVFCEMMINYFILGKFK